MNGKELIEIVIHGNEERNIEYKSTMNWNDSRIKAKITKSVLAMVNLRDGGFLVLGVEPEQHNPVGMSKDDFDSFSQDDISQHISEYADPFVEVTLNKICIESNHPDEKIAGNKYIVIQVREFEELPVICKKDGVENLNEGEIYIRTRRKYESAKVPSQTEMREILDLAVDKAIRKFRGKLSILGMEKLSPKDEKEESENKFKEQRREVDQ